MYGQHVRFRNSENVLRNQKRSFANLWTTTVYNVRRIFEKPSYSKFSAMVGSTRAWRGSKTSVLRNQPTEKQLGCILKLLFVYFPFLYHVKLVP